MRKIDYVNALMGQVSSIQTPHSAVNQMTQMPVSAIQFKDPPPQAYRDLHMALYTFIMRHLDKVEILKSMNFDGGYKVEFERKDRLAGTSKQAPHYIFYYTYEPLIEGAPERLMVALGAPKEERQAHKKGQGPDQPQAVGGPVTAVNDDRTA